MGCERYADGHHGISRVAARRLQLATGTGQRGSLTVARLVDPGRAPIQGQILIRGDRMWTTSRKGEGRVDDLHAVFTETSLVLVRQYKGLTVPEIADLRAAMREAGVSFTVAKNRLALRALEGTTLRRSGRTCSEGSDCDRMVADPVAVAEDGQWTSLARTTRSRSSGRGARGVIAPTAVEGAGRTALARGGARAAPRPDPAHRRPRSRAVLQAPGAAGRAGASA